MTKSTRRAFLGVMTGKSAFRLCAFDASRSITFPALPAPDAGWRDAVAAAAKAAREELHDVADARPA